MTMKELLKIEGFHLGHDNTIMYFNKNKVDGVKVDLGVLFQFGYEEETIDLSFLIYLVGKTAYEAGATDTKITALSNIERLILTDKAKCKPQKGYPETEKEREELIETFKELGFKIIDVNTSCDNNNLKP